MQARTEGLTELSRDECLALVRSHPVHVGRLGLSDDDGNPLVLPINYRLDGDAVVMRTHADSLIGRRARGQRIAFEVDAVDPAWREGWSVVFQGRAEAVEDEGELERLRSLPLHAWAPGVKDLHLRLDPISVTGRRIT